MVGFATISWECGVAEDSSTPRGIVANMLEVVQKLLKCTKIASLMRYREAIQDTKKIRIFKIR
jgi:hypothetical protein